MTATILLALPLIAFQPADLPTLARVEVRAHTPSGKPITQLAPTDLHLIENQTPRPIVHLARDEHPLDLLVLINTSRPHPNLATQLRDAVSALREQDRIAIMTFHELTLPLSPPHAGIDVLFDQLERRKVAAPKPQPLFEAAKYLQERSPASYRRAILVVTDGASFRGATTPELLTVVHDSDITINAILPAQSNTTRRMAPLKQATSPDAAMLAADIRTLIHESSGEILRYGTEPQPITRMVERLTHRYTVFYEAAEPARTDRHVVVTLSDEGKSNHPRSTVLGRRVYVP